MYDGNGSSDNGKPLLNDIGCLAQVFVFFPIVERFHLHNTHIVLAGFLFFA